MNLYIRVSNCIVNGIYCACWNKNIFTEKWNNNNYFIFSGIGQDTVQASLNKNPHRALVKPKFSNKEDLKPVLASQPYDHVQIDLVDFRSMPSTLHGTVYNHVLSVLDIFSRFLVLRPLTNTESLELANQLREIFYSFGLPKKVQSDNGSEFKGKLWNVMNMYFKNFLHDFCFRDKGVVNACKQICPNFSKSCILTNKVTKFR